MLRQPQAHTERGIDVLVIDNMSGQAKSLQSKLERGGLEVTSFILNIPSKGGATRQVPQNAIDKVVSVIQEQHPKILLVDICLDETVFDTTDEKHATWTGPALMSEIRTRIAGQRMASYSAYARYVEAIDKDIEDQRRQHSVADTPHWSVTEITVEKVKGAML